MTTPSDVPFVRRFVVKLRYHDDELVDYATSDDLERALQSAVSAAHQTGVRSVTITDAEAPSVVLICERVD